MWAAAEETGEGSFSASVKWQRLSQEWCLAVCFVQEGPGGFPIRDMIWDLLWLELEIPSLVCQYGCSFFFIRSCPQTQAVNEDCVNAGFISAKMWNVSGAGHLL